MVHDADVPRGRTTLTPVDAGASVPRTGGAESEIQHVFLNEERVVPTAGIDGSWFLDTGANNHMTGTREFFTTIDERIKGTVRFGDGSMVEIQGRGYVLFECRKGEHKVLMEVYYIPRLKSNIISLG